MTETQIDLLTDPLAAANLTQEERQTWESLKAELIIARTQIEQLESRLHALKRQSPEDHFTQTVLTRPEFNREVARMLAFDERYGGVSSVLYFDIENMTDIVKRCGRSVTDAMIRCIADTFSHNIRSSDILGRLATDEFGILLARCDNGAAWKKGESLAMELLKALGEIQSLDVKPVLSYGAYTFREKEDVSSGLRQAAATVTTASLEN